MKTILKKKPKRIEEKIKYEQELLEYIQPQGGIKFSVDYARSGTGYESCIQIYQFPTYIYTHWLSDICYFEGAITTLDIHTENEEAALQNISKSMREYRGRSGSEKTTPAFQMQLMLTTIYQFYMKLLAVDTKHLNL